MKKKKRKKEKSRMKIERIFTNMSKQAIAKELGISRSGISESFSKFQALGDLDRSMMWSSLKVVA